MRQILRSEIEAGLPAVAVDVAYSVFLGLFGTRHAEHPADWDAPGPVELWFFDLPWGHKITLEYHLAISQVHIHVDSLEIEAVVEFIGLGKYPRHLSAYFIDLLRSGAVEHAPALIRSNLYRQDDNGKQFLVHSYESQRIAHYYQQIYEARGHKQRYWVEVSAEP